MTPQGGKGTDPAKAEEPPRLLGTFWPPCEPRAKADAAVRKQRPRASLQLLPSPWWPTPTRRLQVGQPFHHTHSFCLTTHSTTNLLWFFPLRCMLCGKGTPGGAGWPFGTTTGTELSYASLQRRNRCHQTAACARRIPEETWAVTLQSRCE